MKTNSAFNVLHQKLHHPRDWRVRAEAIKALAEIHTTQAMNAILESLYDESPHVVQAATRGLESFGKEAVPGMLEVLYSPKDIVARRFIIHALDDLKDSELVPHFIHFLDDADVGMCYAAALALTKVPDKRAQPHLLRALKRANAPKMQIVRALDAIGDPQIASHLADVLFDDDSATCRYTAIALGRMKTPEASGMLLVASHHEQADVRRAAAEGLGIFNSDQTYERLVLMLTEDDNLVRSSVVMALGETKREAAVPILLSLLKNDNQNLSLHRALADTGDLRVVLPLLQAYREDYLPNGQGLSGLAHTFWQYRARGDSVLPEVLAAMQSTDARLQICSVWLFHDISFNYAPSSETGRVDFQLQHLDQFRTLLTSENPDTRLAALVCLSSTALSLVADKVIELLNDSDSVIREMAARALAYVKTQLSIDALSATVQSSNDKLRRLAVISLVQIGGEKVVDVLIASLEHKDEWTRRNAAWGLGNLQSQRAVPSLLSALRDETDNTVLSSIIMALGELKDASAIPEFIKLLTQEDQESFTKSPFDSALYALKMNNSEEALSALYKVMNESSRWQRKMDAVEAISNVGSDRDSADRMFELLGHEDDTVRTTASKELGYLGARTKDLDLRDYIVSNLINRLHDSGAGYHWSPTVAHMAAKSLYYVGTTEAIEALKKWKSEGENGEG